MPVRIDTFASLPRPDSAQLMARLAKLPSGEVVLYGDMPRPDFWLEDATVAFGEPEVPTVLEVLQNSERLPYFDPLRIHKIGGKVLAGLDVSLDESNVIASLAKGNRQEGLGLALALQAFNSYSISDTARVVARSYWQNVGDPAAALRTYANNALFGFVRLEACKTIPGDGFARIVVQRSAELLNTRDVDPSDLTD